MAKSAEPVKYPVTVGELRKLGKFVSDSSTQAPASVLVIARRAITLRKNVTSWFVGQGSDATDKRHAHFIEAMEEICNLLEWRFNERKSTNDGNGTTEPTAETQGDCDDKAWLNRFAALTVDEPEDIPETVSEHNEIIKVVAMEDEAEDEGIVFSHAFFRILCLFHDLQSWRDFINRTVSHRLTLVNKADLSQWKEYAELNIDLMSASVVTDSALQFARDLIQETRDSLPPGFFQSGLDLQMIVFETGCVTRGEVGPASQELGLAFNVRMADLAEWCYLGVGSLLQSFVPIIQKNSIPVYKPGYFGVYDPKANRAEMSVAEKFHEDKLLLLEVLPEFCMLNAFNVSMPVRDEITTGLVGFARHKKPDLWLCFATQIMLDTHHALRASRTGAFSDLRLTGLRIAKTLDDFLKLSQTHAKPPFWPNEGDEEIRRIRELIKLHIEDDPLVHLRNAAELEAGRSKTSGSEHLLFQRNPLLCGLMMFQLNLRMQTIGQALVNRWYDVQQMAFLYNLIQKQDPQELTWPDMELFLKIHGEDRIFIGDRPKDADQSLRRLELATGISSTTRFASNSRIGAREWHKPDGKDPRILGPTTTCANLFRERYQDQIVGNVRNVSLYKVGVGKFLDELTGPSTTKSKSFKAGKGAELELSLANPQLLLHKSHSIGALQLLVLVKTKLYEEEPILLFNYFSMHRRSIEILRLIQAQEHHKLVQYFTRDYMPSDAFISNLVLLVLHVAHGSALAGKDLGLESRSSSVVSGIIMRCGDLMRPYLDKHGSTVIKELKTFGRNKAHLNGDLSNISSQKEAESSSAYRFGLEDILSPGAMESLKTGIPLA